MEPKGMSRRRALAAIAGAGMPTLVGCVSEGPDSAGGPGTNTSTVNATASPTKTPAQTPSETPTATPEPGCTSTYQDSFERDALGAEFTRVRTAGSAEITDQHAHSGTRSLRMASETNRSITAVHSNTCFRGELTVETAIKRVKDGGESTRGAATAATVSLIDASGTGYPKYPRVSISVQNALQGDGERLVVRQFNEETRVTISDIVHTTVPLGAWRTLSLTIGQSSLVVEVGDTKRPVATQTDWSKRRFSLALRLRDSGEADGIVAAMDDVSVEPA